MMISALFRPIFSLCKKLAGVVLWLLSIVAIVVFLRLFIFEPCNVPSGSMENAIMTGDWWVINKLAYGGRLPRRIGDIPIVNGLTWIRSVREKDALRHWKYNRVPGYSPIRRFDVVVFQQNDPSAPALVKRVIAMPGDTLRIEEGRVYINGKFQPDPTSVQPNLPDQNGVVDFPNRDLNWTWRNYGPLIIPEANYFVMGDCRGNSIDSRMWGFVPEANILGRMSFSLFSVDPSKKGFSAIRTDRFFKFM